MKSEYTRTGVRRSGDYYQDIVALDIFVEMLEHPNRYIWVEVDAGEFGYLDDVVAQRSDDSFVLKQVKFSVYPDKVDDLWTWDDLLEQKPQKPKSLL